MQELLPNQLKGGLSLTKQIIVARRISDWPKGFVKFIKIYLVLLNLIAAFGTPIFFKEIGCGEVIGGDRYPCITDGGGLLTHVYSILFVLYGVHFIIIYPVIILFAALFFLASKPLFAAVSAFLILGLFVAFAFYNALFRFFLIMLFICFFWLAVSPVLHILFQLLDISVFK